ncbi:hypothetical protein SRHO_G00240130 [Serrasalmus rhombeus]
MQAFISSVSASLSLTGLNLRPLLVVAGAVTTTAGAYYIYTRTRDRQQDRTAVTSAICTETEDSTDGCMFFKDEMGVLLNGVYSMEDGVMWLLGWLLADAMRTSTNFCKALAPSGPEFGSLSVCWVPGWMYNLLAWYQICLDHFSVKALWTTPPTGYQITATTSRLCNSFFSGAVKSLNSLVPCVKCSEGLYRTCCYWSSVSGI